MNTSADSASHLIIHDATTPDQLDGLPGIGKTTAGKIINGRLYNDLQELLTKKFVSTKVFNGMKDNISTY